MICQRPEHQAGEPKRRPSSERIQPEATCSGDFQDADQRHGPSRQPELAKLLSKRFGSSEFCAARKKEGGAQQAFKYKKSAIQFSVFL